MIYENNEQIREFIKKIMRDEQLTYDELAEKIGGTKQNAYKIVNKNQLKFDDVKRICEALGYKLEIGISKNNEQMVLDLYDLYINDEFMDLIGKMVRLAKDVDYEKIVKRRDEMKISLEQK